MSSHADEKRGWRVGHRGRDQMYYEELHDGAWERIEIDGEMLMGRAHHVIYFASPERWLRYPPWARHRRDEIIARITSELREPDYEYSGLDGSRGSETGPGTPTAGGDAPATPPASPPLPRDSARPPARRATSDATGLRALLLAVVLLLGIAACMGWVVTRSVARGETWYPNTRPSLRRMVSRQTEPGMFWVSTGLYAVIGATTLTLGTLGARAARRLTG